MSKNAFWMPRDEIKIESAFGEIPNTKEGFREWIFPRGFPYFPMDRMTSRTGERWRERCGAGLMWDADRVGEFSPGRDACWVGEG